MDDGKFVSTQPPESTSERVIRKARARCAEAGFAESTTPLVDAWYVDHKGHDSTHVLVNWPQKLGRDGRRPHRHRSIRGCDHPSARSTRCASCCSPPSNGWTPERRICREQHLAKVKHEAHGGARRVQADPTTEHERRRAADEVGAPGFVTTRRRGSSQRGPPGRCIRDPERSAGPRCGSCSARTARTSGVTRTTSRRP